MISLPEDGSWSSDAVAFEFAKSEYTHYNCALSVAASRWVGVFLRLWAPFFFEKGTQVMSDKIRFLTREGIRKLEDELEHLCSAKRPEIAHNLKAAIEEGDITENAGYDESKREQALVEGRILEIRATLASARPLEESGSHHTVALGARVTVVEEGSAPEQYQIVSSVEADPMIGYISDESPLGKALMGHSVDDSVQVQAPSGVTCFKIISVK